jgi:hypothetical protein
MRFFSIQLIQSRYAGLKKEQVVAVIKDTDNLQ